MIKCPRKLGIKNRVISRVLVKNLLRDIISDTWDVICQNETVLQHEFSTEFSTTEYSEEKLLWSNEEYSRFSSEFSTNFYINKCPKVKKSLTRSSGHNTCPEGKRRRVQTCFEFEEQLVQRRHQEVFIFWSLSLKKGFMKCDERGPISKGVKRKDGREHKNNSSRHIISHEGHNTDHEGLINMTESHKSLPGGHKGQTESHIISPQNIGHKGFVNTTLTHTSLHEGQSDSNCVSNDIFSTMMRSGGKKGGVKRNSSNLSQETLSNHIRGPGKRQGKSKCKSYSGHPSHNIAKGQGMITSYFKSENCNTSKGPIIGKVLNTCETSDQPSVIHYPLSENFSTTEEEKLTGQFRVNSQKDNISRKL